MKYCRHIQYGYCHGRRRFSDGSISVSYIALYNSSGRAYDEATGLSGISKSGIPALTYEDNKTVVFKTSENSSQYDSFAASN